MVQMNKLTAIIKLTRIEHSVLLIIAVLAAEAIVASFPAPAILILSIVSPALISAGAFAINDYYDVETDRANKRLGRPIVSGAISKKDAHLIALLCFGAGVALSALINAQAFVVAFIFAVLAVLYSRNLKDVLLVGNAYVGLSYAIPFIYGDLVVSSSVIPSIILISIAVFLIGFAREIHGMVRDRFGDSRVRQTNSLIKYIGVRYSVWIALVLYLEGIMISFYLFFFIAPFINNLVFLVPIAVADLIFLYIAVGHVVYDGRRFFDLARTLSLVAMGISVLTYLFAALYYVAI